MPKRFDPHFAPRPDLFAIPSPNCLGCIFSHSDSPTVCGNPNGGHKFCTAIHRPDRASVIFRNKPSNLKDYTVKTVGSIESGDWIQNAVTEEVAQAKPDIIGISVNYFFRVWAKPKPATPEPSAMTALELLVDLSKLKRALAELGYKLEKLDRT